MSGRIVAPWTVEQVEALNLFQRSGVAHPFTCPRGHSQLKPLVATADGWVCPNDGCDYTQDWAHASMADREETERGMAYLHRLFSALR